MVFSTRLISGIRRCVYLFLAGIDRFFGRRVPMIVIFAYHSIASDKWRFSIDHDVFEKQIEHLLSVRQPVTLSEVRKHITGECPILSPSFVICFDDGYEDILSVREFLHEKGVVPSVFVLSDSEHASIGELGTRREFLSSGEICELYSMGWEIGCHSSTHGDFWAMSPEKIREETVGAKQKLESELGFSIRFFAYPKGRYTDVVKAAVRDAGYDLALSMDDGFLSTETDLFAVPRIGVDRTHSMREFTMLFTSSAVQFRKMVKRFINF